MGWPWVNDSGIGWPFMAASRGLWSKVSRGDAPPAMYSQMIRRARGVWCGGLTTPGQRWPCSPWLPATRWSRLSKAASANAPRPALDRPRNARRVRYWWSGSAGCMRVPWLLLDRLHLVGFEDWLAALAGTE